MMMSQGRGNAIAVLVLLLGMLLHCGNVWAATYTVGDAGGWAFNVVGWPNGKTFRAGDVLVFNYNPTLHNVVGVGKHGYDTCTAAGQKFQTGRDKIKLVKGFNYFICGFPGHCASNMKIAVNAM
ncbi:basic blue protein-like [Quercus robur]|uniref:basic blue protein-like n=1 Tax=Quercus robur TaxID=38942 RepID=UPI002162AEC4|nr:basic blue protein-like [Quercus robur]